MMRANQFSDESATSSADIKLSDKAELQPAESSIEHVESPKVTVNFGEKPGDVIIDTDDKRFSCHKNVLTQHSLYFHAMFNSGMKESQTNEIHLENMASEQVQCVLDYFYTGDLQLTPYNVQQMTEVSSLLQVSFILGECCNLLMTMIEDDLCLSLMRLSNALTLPEIYDHSRRHALWHFPRVCQTEDFTDAPLGQIIDYLQDPHLNIDNETDVFVAAAVWYSAQKEPCQVTDLPEFFGSVVSFHIMKKEEVALLQDLPEVQENQSLKTFVHSLCETDMVTKLTTMDPSRVRTSPRNGRILCVGAHQCSLSSCQNRLCDCIQNEESPLDVMGFEPEDCSLERLASMSDHYPLHAVGYGVCAIGHLVYVVGGESGLGKTGGWLTTIWCLDTLRWSWHEAGILDKVRRHHGLCARDKTLFLIGGFGRFRIRLESAQSFNTETEEWSDLPNMLYQETSPAVAHHNGNIYVFKNYIQVLNLATLTWTELNLIKRVPGMPVFAQSHPDPSINAIFVCCFHSQSLWLVDPSDRDCKQVTLFEKEGAGGALCGNHIYHFEVHELVSKSDIQVECFSIEDETRRVIGVLGGTVLTPHFVTVPRLPHYTPSSSKPLC